MEALAVLVSFAGAATAVVALLNSVRQASRQNLLPVTVDLFREPRTPEWLGARAYVLNELSKEHSPKSGVSGLPAPARERVQKVAFFYDNLGILVTYGLIPEALAIGGYGVGMREAWDVLQPYARREAAIRNLEYLVYFEDLVCRLAETSPEQVYRDLGLRRFDKEGHPTRRR